MERNNDSQRGQSQAPLLQPDEFRFTVYRFKLHLMHPVRLPVYKGSTFHGALGHALMHISTRFYQLFFEPDPPDHWVSRGQAPPKPFLLIPPLEPKQFYRSGDEIDLGLILYGGINDHFMVVCTALEHLGEKMGLGRERARFHIESISAVRSDTEIPVLQSGGWTAPPPPMNAAQMQQAVPQTDVVTICLSTRLRLTHNNRLVRHTPSFHLFLERLLGRINILAQTWCGGNMISGNAKNRLLKMSNTIIVTGNGVRWKDWTRYSGKQREVMKFGGLQGNITYRGDLAPYLPWLSLGQWTGVGGKTSFGLGLYHLDYGQPVEKT